MTIEQIKEKHTQEGYQLWETKFENDSDADLVCFIDPDRKELCFVYIGEKEVFNLLSESVCYDIEKEYRESVRLEKEQSAIDNSLANEVHHD